jgi:hypothetical protein
MTQARQSYAQGRWQDGTGEQRPLTAATQPVFSDPAALVPDAKDKS